MLQTWVQWHTQQQGSAGGGSASGQLTFGPDLLLPGAVTGDGLILNIDDAPMRRQPTSETFNVAYERANAVPMYVREFQGAILEPAVSSRKRSSTAGETKAAADGTAAAAAAAGPAESGLEKEEAEEDEEGEVLVASGPRSAKRPRLLTGRCFNCGSYSHSLRVSPPRLRAGSGKRTGALRAP